MKEKERMERRLKEIEDEARAKEKQYKEKYQKAELRRQELIEEKQAKAIRASKPYVAPPEGNVRSSSVPAQKSLAAIGHSDPQNQII